MSSSELSTLITYNPATVSADSPLIDVRRKMQMLGVRHLPVVDSGHRLVGIVSEWDARRQANENQMASEAMTSSPATCDINEPPLSALDKMRRRGFHSLPVLENGRLVGIVTTTDFLREFSYGETPMSREPASRIAASADAHVDAAESLKTCLALMTELKIDHLAVVKGECPIGVVSRRNIVSESLASGDDLFLDAQAGLVANTNAPVIQTADALSTAAAKIVDSGCGAAIVVNRANRLAGLVTEDAIIASILEPLELALA
jgi:CBS domain-containing protein